MILNTFLNGTIKMSGLTPLDPSLALFIKMSGLMPLYSSLALCYMEMAGLAPLSDCREEDNMFKAPNSYKEKHKIRASSRNNDEETKGAEPRHLRKAIEKAILVRGRALKS